MIDIKKEFKRAKSLVIITFILLCGASISYAQNMTTSKAVDQIDEMTKVLGFLGIVGGFFIGYLQVRIGIKVAELEIKLTNMINTIRLEMISLVKIEITSLDKKITETTKEIKTEMVTSKEVEALRREEELRHKVVEGELKGIAKILEKK